MQLGAFDVFCRLKMVGRYDNLVLVEYLIDSLFNQHRYRRRRRYIVAHHHINLRVYKLARFYSFVSTRPCENFLCYCHTHLFFVLMLLCIYAFLLFLTVPL